MSEAEVHVDWRMTPGEWEQLRAVLIADAVSHPDYYPARLLAEGKLGPPLEEYGAAWGTEDDGP